MIIFLLSFGSVFAVCNVFEIKCLDSEFAFDFIGKLIDFVSTLIGD